MTELTELARSLDLTQCKEGFSDYVIRVVQSIEDIDKDTQEGQQKYSFALKHLLGLALQHETQMCSKVSQDTQLLHEMSSKPQTTIDLGLNLDKLNLTGMSDSVLRDYKGQGSMDKAIIFGMKLMNFLAISLVLYMFAKLILS